MVREEDGRLIPVALLTRADVVLAYARGRKRLAAATERARALGRPEAGGVAPIELAVERTDDANGRTLAELDLPQQAADTAVQGNGAVLIPRGPLRVLTGDRVRILSSADRAGRTSG